MLHERLSPENLSEFLRYLAENGHGESERLPTLSDLSQQLGVSVATLREQMEVARALGLVEVRPKTGIRRLPYAFGPAVRRSLAYALAVDPSLFDAYSDLRKHIENAYWHRAVRLLNSEDMARLKDLVYQAWIKLRGRPVQIPHPEHRDLHMLIYRRLENPFVTGLLESYWEMYEAVGLAFYTDLTYLEKVWQYHEKMVERICIGDYTGGYQAMVDHMSLLSQREQVISRQQFE